MSAKAKTRGLPHGGRLIHTSAAGFLCGLYSLINSIAAQFPEWHVPTIKELQSLLNTPEAREFNKGTQYAGLNSTNNLRIDQIALILKQWGLKRNPQLHLRLGVIVEGVSEPTLPPMEDFPDTIWVWIYNDGHSLEDESDQDDDVDVENAATRKLGHYSGISPMQSSSSAQVSPSGRLSQLGTALNMVIGIGEPPKHRRRRGPSSSPKEGRKWRRNASLTDPDGYIIQKWQGLDKRIKALINNTFLHACHEVSLPINDFKSSNTTLTWPTGSYSLERTEPTSFRDICGRPSRSAFLQRSPDTGPASTKVIERRTMCTTKLKCS